MTHHSPTIPRLGVGLANAVAEDLKNRSSPGCFGRVSRHPAFWDLAEWDLGRKKTWLRAIPPVPHDFVIVSDISSGYMAHVFWHSILAFSLTSYLASFLASILTFSLAFYLAFILIFYLASILTFFLASILSFCLTFYFSKTATWYMPYLMTFFLVYVSGISSDIFPAFYMVYLQIFFVAEVRRGTLAVKVKQGTLWSSACSWGPAEEGGGGWGGGGGGPADVKSNKPHLTGGEKNYLFTSKERCMLPSWPRAHTVAEKFGHFGIYNYPNLSHLSQQRHERDCIYRDTWLQSLWYRPSQDSAPTYFPALCYVPGFIDPHKTWISINGLGPGEHLYPKQKMVFGPKSKWFSVFWTYWTSAIM